MTTQAIVVSEYDQQALDFATKYGVKLSVLSHRFDSMPWDKDGQKRNIFKLKLSRGKNSYSFDFGSSVADSCKKTVSTEWDNLQDTDKIKFYAGIKHSVLGLIMIDFELSKAEAVNVDNNKILSLIAEFVQKMDKAITEYNNKNRRINHLTNESKYRAETMIVNSISRKVKALHNAKVTTYTDRADTIVTPSMYGVLAVLQKYDPDTFENFCNEFGYDVDSISAHRTYKGVVKEWRGVERLFSDVLDELQEIQ